MSTRSFKSSYRLSLYGSVKRYILLTHSSFNFSLWVLNDFIMHRMLTKLRVMQQGQVYLKLSPTIMTFPLMATDSRQPLSSLTNTRRERAYLKGRLAAAFRIFGQKGFDERVAGHITVRDPVDPHTMWVNPFGVAFNQMRRSYLLRIDYDGNFLEGGHDKMVNRAAVLIYAAVHKARSDVICATHIHSIYSRSFSTMGIPLPITTQDGCAFYNDLALYNSFECIVLEEPKGDHIPKAIGSKKACILQNHGLLTAAASVEATALFWYISLEKLCQTQLLAMAAVAGTNITIKEVEETEAQDSYLSLGQEMSGWFSAKPLFDCTCEDIKEAYLA